MTFASARQIVLLIVLTAGLLFVVDRIKRPRRAVVPGEPAVPSAVAEKPTIRLSLNHLSCAGCLGGLNTALSEVPWLDPPKVADGLPSAERATQSPGIEEPRQQVVVGIKDLRSIDFIAVLTALHKSGFTPAQMELSGVPHYRIEAELPHMCSPGCVEGTREAMDGLVRASRPKGWFGWLDSYRVDGVNEALVIYPRMGVTVDMMEVLGAINTIGFEPGALTVHVQGAR